MRRHATMPQHLEHLDLMDAETFNKARLYSLEKSSFDLVHSTYSHFEMTAILFLGVLPLLWTCSGTLLELSANNWFLLVEALVYWVPLNWSLGWIPLWTASPSTADTRASNASDTVPLLGVGGNAANKGSIGGSTVPFAASSHPILQSLSFALVGLVISTITELPWDLYSTFIVEQRHGFNQQTARFYAWDQCKKLALTAALTLPILSGFLWIIEETGDRFYLYAWGFVVTVQLFLVSIYPAWIAPLFDRYEPLPEGTRTTSLFVFVPFFCLFCLYILIHTLPWINTAPLKSIS